MNESKATPNPTFTRRSNASRWWAGLGALSILLVEGLQAQTPGSLDLSTPASRQQAVVRLQNESAQAKSIAEQTAQRMGWPVKGQTPDGASFELMRLENGRPVYYITHNVNAAISTATNLIRNTAPYNLNGGGLTVGVWDAGSIRSTHQEFAGRVNNMNAVLSHPHATHVGGTVGATGVDAAALGMAPSVTLDSYDWNSDAAEMTGRAATGAGVPPGSIYVSNHSYGIPVGWANGNFSGNPPPAALHWLGTFGEREDRNFGQYNATAVSWDSICYAAPYYLPFNAAGNDRNDTAPPVGTNFFYWNGGWQSKAYVAATDPFGDGWDNGGFDTMGPSATAKNIMTVGAVNDAVSGGIRSPANGTMADFSCWGPTDDGRIKPDIVANGVDVYSTDDANDTAYNTESGTSMATPNACGSAILLQEFYGRLFPGQAMRSSTLKGLIIHTADDIGNAGPDYSYGWGLMNAQAAADHVLAHSELPEFNLIIEDQLNASNAQDTYPFFSKGNDPIRVTLCWTDPAGTAQAGLDTATSVLVNDLDLRILGPGGSPTYFPYILNPANPANPAFPGDNVRDNVEQVYIAAPPVSGTYTVVVNHKGSLTNGQQQYSLIKPIPPCAPNTLLRSIPNPAPAYDDEFGYSVGISGNLAVVGAWGEDVGAVFSVGIAYVYNARTGALLATLNNPDSGSGGEFGRSVAISGNLVVVGAPSYDDPVGYYNRGRAYVFDATSGTLMATLENPTPEGDAFGQSVAISGNRIVVGAPWEDPGGVSSAGTVYIFNATGGLLTTLNNPAPDINDYFGNSVAISGNLAAVGAVRNHPGGGGFPGQAYVFNVSTGALQATLNKPSPEPLDHFGNSVAISGNLVVVGAPNETPPGTGGAVGTAYVFNATTGALRATLSNPAPMLEDAFGLSVAISGNLAVVGVPYDRPDGVTFAGTAYVFDATTTNSLVAVLNNPLPVEPDFFGWSVAISGNVAAVGAWADDPSGAISAGSAYTFSCTSATPTPTPTPNPTASPTTMPSRTATNTPTRTSSPTPSRTPTPTPTKSPTSTKSPTPTVTKSPTPSPTKSPTPTITKSSTPSPTKSPTPTVTKSPTPSPTKSPTPTSTKTATVTPSPTPSPTSGPTPSPTPFNDAQVVTHTIPAQIAANHGVPVQITMINTGTTTWSALTNYSLAVITDTCALVSGIRLGIAPGVSVAPGQSHTFTTTLTAPAATGTCPIEFRMVQEFVEFFGQTLSLTPQIVAAVNNAVVTDSTIPAHMSPGQTLGVGITMKNTGNTVWYPGSNHTLAVTSDPCGIFGGMARISIRPGDVVQPGQRYQFITTIQAPATPQTCPIQLRMVEEFVEFFGQTLDQILTIAVPANASRDWEIYN